MQQKVAIARALLTSRRCCCWTSRRPASIPIEAGRSVLHRRTAGDHDATIVLTTHDLAEADRLCGRIGILAGAADGGRNASALKADIASEHGAAPTLESVFMKYTGALSMTISIQQSWI